MVLQSMVERTLGKGGARFASATYIFLHYSLLVAYISRAGGSIASTTGQPLWLTAAVFASALAGLCYTASPRQLDTANTALLALVILSFLGLLWVALPGVSLENLQAGSWPAVVDTLPVVALAFVFQNVVPVVVTQLEGDVKKVRIAVWTGLAIPLVMFIGWEGAMLGSLAPGMHLRLLIRTQNQMCIVAQTSCFEIEEVLVHVLADRPRRTVLFLQPLCSYSDHFTFRCLDRSHES